MRMTRTRQRWVNRLTIVVALAAVAVSVVAGATLGAATAHNQHVRVLPETFGPPVRLAAGKYKTRPGFSPASMFTVGSGWYGAGSSRDWAVGKGFNQAEERFGLAGIWTSRLPISYTRAVARFRALMTLEAGPSTPIRSAVIPVLPSARRSREITPFFPALLRDSTLSTRRAGSRSSSTCEARRCFSGSRSLRLPLVTPPFARSCERFDSRAKANGLAVGATRSRRPTLLLARVAQARGLRAHPRSPRRSPDR